MVESKNLYNKSFEVKRISNQQYIYVVGSFVVGITLAAIVRENTMAMLSMIAITIFIITYFLTKKGYKEKTFVEVDDTGIWVHNRQITDWQHYLGTTIKREKRLNDYSKAEYFVLAINISYTKDNEDGYFINKIYFTNGEDKSEKDLVNAIEFFYNKFQQPIINKRLR